MKSARVIKNEKIRIYRSSRKNKGKTNACIINCQNTKGRKGKISLPPCGSREKKNHYFEAKRKSRTRRKNNLVSDSSEQGGERKRNKSDKKRKGRARSMLYKEGGPGVIGMGPKGAIKSERKNITQSPHPKSTRQKKNTIPRSWSCDRKQKRGGERETKIRRPGTKDGSA